MHLIQLLLPIRDNEGRPFARELFERVRGELTERFGGATAHLRAPAHGLWRDAGGEIAHDDVVIVEVMCDELDRAFWTSYRTRLASELGQEELVVRALPFEPL